MEKFQRDERLHAEDNWRCLPPKEAGLLHVTEFDDVRRLFSHGNAEIAAARVERTGPRFIVIPLYYFSLIPAGDFTCKVHLEHKDAEQEPT